MAAQIGHARPAAEWREIDGWPSVFQGFIAVEEIYGPHPIPGTTHTGSASTTSFTA